MGLYPGLKSDLVPCSDMAGEVVAIGNNVANWEKGDRVMSNFTLDHIFGDLTEDIKATALGAPIDGVLTQYKNFPAHVSHISYPSY